MKKFILVCFFAMYSLFANAQWEQCPLYGGSIFSLAVNNTNVYAGTLGGGGIFFTNNYGSNWVAVNNGLLVDAYFTVFSIYVNGSEIYAGTSDGIYKSIDSGYVWTPINNGLPPSNFGAYSILVSDTTIFAASPNGPWGIYKSTDGGNNWTNANNGITDSSIMCMAVDSTGIYAGATDGGGIYKSTNNGASWFLCNNGLPSGWSVVFDIIVYNDDLYVSYHYPASGYFIYKSVDHGSTWTLFSNPSFYGYKMAFCDSNLYVATYDNGVYYTSDGQSWQTVNSGLTSLVVRDLAVNGSDLFAGTNSGVFLLQQDSTTWIPRSNGISAMAMKTISGFGNYLFAGEQISGIYMTDDYGDTWTTKNSGLTDLGIDVLTTNNSTIYFGNNGLYRSNDLGNTWDNINTASTYSPSTIIARNSNIFTGSVEGFRKSTDNGNTWTLSNNGLPASCGIYNLTLNSNNDLYASVFDAGVFFSSDIGSTWLNISNSFAGLSYIKCHTSFDTIIVAGLGNYNPPVVFSYDNGQNWNVGANQLFGLYVNSLKTIENTIFASTTNGVYLTKNGNDWLNVSDGLPNGSSVKTVGNDNTYLYASVSGNGIWKRLLSDFNIIVTSEKVTNNEILIYPNPATTNLYLNNPENLEVKILNLQGQTVSTKTISSNGNIDISGLSNGVYMIQINTKNGILYRKFVKQ